jgi:hypothetical protein
VLAQERGDHAGAGRLWAEVVGECPGDCEAMAMLDRLRGANPAGPRNGTEVSHSPWIVAGSWRRIVPACGPGDFDPYASRAAAWVEALRATTVVELGVRFGASTRALLAGVRAVDEQVWGVDPLERHDVQDPRFTHIPQDPMAVVERWERIDLLHVDIDPHREDDARRWLESYAPRCRAIAVHDRHHPRFHLSPVIAELANRGRWQVFEYRGDPSGWTVLIRPGEPCPSKDTRAAVASGLVPVDRLGRDLLATIRRSRRSM